MVAGIRQVHSGLNFFVSAYLGGFAKLQKKKRPLTSSFYVLLTVHLGIIFENNQLDSQFFFRVYLFLFSTCFGQPYATSSGELIVSI